jgi:hypothetical protein
MIGRITRWLAVVSACTALSAAAHAAPIVVDFGAGVYIFPTLNGTPYEEDGFRFSANDNLGNGITDPSTNGVGHFDILDPTTYPNFGPDRLASVHTGNSGDSVTVDAFGAAFDLLSLEIELFDAPDSGVWEVAASNGSTLTITSTGTVTFDSSWTGITSFVIRSTSVPAIDDLSGNLYFDDISLSVFEPGSVTLAACSVVGLLLSRRRGASRV